MIPKLREQFNREFSQEKYAELLGSLTRKAGLQPGFRVSESPVFLPKSFQNKLKDVCDSILEQIKKIPQSELQKAIPAELFVPNDRAKPHFFTIDFGICEDENGEAVPQLIELQAFPTLYAFQKELQNSFVEVYPFLNKLKPTISDDDYYAELKDLIVGNEDPKNVIILEIFPEKQKTQIDFILTEKNLGIKTVCLTKIKKDGKKLYYSEDNQLVEIKRIYNRVIFDELNKIPDLTLSFDFREELDVEWITHPNWFFKISKFLLPKLQHQFVPKSYFLNSFPDTEKLGDFVLKPLFSFAGSGVILNPTETDIAAITDRENYILQRKVSYAPIFRDIGENFSKGEIRLLYIWKQEDDQPKLMEHLVRLTKAEMINVDFNKKDAIWIGASTAFFEK